MKNKSYVLEVVIGVLILIITSLILKLLSLEVDFLPDWFFGNLFLGIFTLAGAFLGVYFAAKNTEKNIRNQITYQELKEKEKTNLELSKSYLDVKKVFDYLVVYLLEIDKSYLNEFEKKYTVSIGISLTHIKGSLNELNNINLSKYDYIHYKLIKDFNSKVKLLISMLDILELHLDNENKEKYFRQLEKYREETEEILVLNTEFIRLISLSK